MSSVVEQKILEMRFDNKQFEDNVSESISTLDKLKSALNFDKFADVFSSVSAAAGKVDFSPISNGVDTVIVKFNALEVAAVQAVANIIENGINKLQSVINTLSIDQVTEGWGKYNEKTESVQTIMNATGKSIEEVNEQLSRLNWFSDETSFSFTDMTSNVGKFTAVNVELEDAVTAMEGISTWASLSGQSASEASRAYYNLAQAMAVGSVKLMDWRSIENAQMATSEFKKTALETAAAMGTLREFADGTYQTIDKGTNVTIKDFNSALSEGWFTSEVLMKTLEKYGGYANELSKICEETGVAAADMDKAFADWMADARDFEEIAGDTGLTTEELRVYLERLTDTEWELGRKAFLAAQQAKTFGEAIEATKDAVSTGWMNTFEYLFGNYEQAAEFFTDVTSYLWDLFAASGEVRNDILEDWAELGGGDFFRDSILNLLESATNVVEYIRKIIFEITGIWNKDGKLQQSFVKNLVKYTESFAAWTDKLVEFTSNIKLSEKAYEGIKSFFKGLGAAFDIFKNALSALKPVFSWMLDILGSVGSYLVENVFRTIGMCTVALQNFIEHNHLFEKAVSKISEIAIAAWTRIKDVLSPITNLLQPIIDKLSYFFSTDRTYYYFYQQLYNIKSKLEEIFSVSIGFEKVDTILEKLKGGLQWIVDHVTKVFDKISEFVHNHDLGSVLTDIWNLLKNIGNTLWDIASFAGSKFLDFGKDVGNTFKEMFSGIRQAFKDYKIEDVFSSIGTGLSGTIKNLGSADLSGFLGNLGKGALALGGFNLAKLFGNANKGIEALTGSVSEGGIGGFLKGMISPVTDVFDQLKETIGSFTKNTDADKLRAIALSVGVLTIALIAMSGIDSDKMTVALEGLAGVLGGMFLEMKGLAAMDFTKSGSQMKNIGLGMVEMAAAALIMVEAVKPFAEMDGDKLVKSLGAMTVILTEFAAFIAVFGAISRANQVGNTKSEGFFGLFQKSNGFDKQLKNAAFAMIELGAAMKIFASAVKDFDDVNGLKRSIGAMTIVMTEIVAFIFIASKLDTKGITGVAFAMIELGAAMKIFASAMSDMGSIENLLDSMSGMMAITAAMVAFMMVASELADSSGQIVVISAAMVVLGIAMNSFANAMTDLAKIEYEPMKNAIAALIAVGGEMVAFMIIAGKMAKQSGEIVVIAAAMVVLGLAMQTFAKAMDMFAENEPAEWFNAIAQMVVCFGEMLIFIGVANAVAANATQIALISASMIVLGLGMQAFAAAAIDFSKVRWEDLGKAGAVLGGLVVAIAALAAIGSVTGAGLAVVSTSLLAIGGAIALIGVGIAALNLGVFVGHLGEIAQRLIFLTDNLVAMVKAMEINAVIDAIVSALLALPKVITGVITGIITGIISGLGEILGSIGTLLDGAKIAILEFLSFAEEIAPAIIDTLLTILLETLSSMLDKAPEILATIADLILKVLDALIKYLPDIVKKLSVLLIKIFDNLKQYIPEIVVSFMDFMGALLQAIIDVAANTDQQTLEKLAEMFLGLVAVIAVLDLIRSMIPGAMLGLAEIALFVAELGAIIAAFGLLEKIPGFKSLVESGGELLGAIGTAIGKFVGGIVGGFAEGATNALPAIGKNIADFWTNVKPFIDGVSNIDMDIAAKVGVLSASILVLTAADLLSGIADFVRDATNAGEFGTSISKMWTNIKPFIDGVKRLDPNVTSSVESLSKALLILTAAQLVDGITSFIFGKQDIDKFGESISALGPYLKQFSDSVKDIDTNAVKTASESINLLADTFSKGTFKTGGLSQMFSGENDLKKFGEGLAKLGPLIMEYAKSVEGMPVDVIENSVKGATALTEMAKTVPPSGGILQALTGSRDLVEFAKGLSLMGPSLVKYANAVKDLDSSVVEKSILSAKALSEFASNLEEKSLLDRVFKKDKMTEFSESLLTLGTSMKTYYDDIKDISSEHISEVMTGITEMMEMFSENSGKTFKIDKTFTKALKEAAENGINDFVTTIDNNLPLIIERGTILSNKFMEGIESQKTNLVAAVNKILSDIISKISTYMTTFKRYGTNLMASFNSGVAGVMSSIDVTVTNIVNKMKEQLGSVSLQTWFRNAGTTLMTQFATGIVESINTVTTAVSTMASASLGQLTNQELLSSFVNAGSNVGASFTQGLKSQAQSVQEAANALASNAKTSVNEALAQTKENIAAVMSSVDYSPTITPVLDMTDAERELENLKKEYAELGLDVDNLMKAAQTVQPYYDAINKVAKNAETYVAEITQNFFGDNVDPNDVKKATTEGVGIAAERKLGGVLINNMINY